MPHRFNDLLIMANGVYFPFSEATPFIRLEYHIKSKNAMCK